MMTHIENSKLVKSKRNMEEIAREIVDYSFQKDAYQGHRVVGDYLIAYMVEKPRSLQFLRGGKLMEEKLQKENAYIGVAVHSTSDYHFIDNLSVTVTVIDEMGNLIGKQQHLYHQRPELHHYGKNWILPGDGLFTLRVIIEDQDLKMEGSMKHISSSGLVEVEFNGVKIETGKHFG